MVEQREVNVDLSKQTIFSDEAHFYLNEFVFKHNCQIFGLKSPQVIHEKEVHPQQATVWYRFWQSDVIGPPLKVGLEMR